MSQARTDIQHLHQFKLELIPLSTLPLSNTQPQRLKIGLSCLWPQAFQRGQWLRLRIPAIAEEVIADTCVIDCDPTSLGYQLTLEFADQEQAYRFRMIEQLCHIHLYHQQLKTTGRKLSLNDAAIEWIQQFSESFPSIANAS